MLITRRCGGPVGEAMAIVKQLAQIVGAFMLVGAVVATVMGHGGDFGVPLAFMGVFWFFLFPRHLRRKSTPPADTTSEASGKAGPPQKQG